MDSPISPIIADIVMDDIERKALNNLKFKMPFYCRYVDDIALAVPSNKTELILNTFNSFHPRLQFTLEIGGKVLNFLDVTIIKNDNNLEFDFYTKPTFSGRFLSYMSQHPMSQKRGVIMSAIDRVFLLSHPKYHEKNFNFLIETFLDNGYPLQFIFETIHIRLNNLFKKRTKNQNQNNTNDEGYKSWFVIPFIQKLTDKFKNITNMIKSKLTFFSLNKLGRVIRAQKDPLQLGSNKNVVYKLKCTNCDATYIGQTKRRLITRVAEHRNDINKKTPNHSPSLVITNHRLEFQHDFDWDNPSILDKEEKYYKRLISEMINIKTHKKAINLQSDTELLQQSYSEILNTLKVK